MKRKYKLILSFSMLILLLLWLNKYTSYSRRIGDTNFYLVETLANSKNGTPLVGLYYKDITTGGYTGEFTPEYPQIILWNDKYLIAKNFDGNTPIIRSYIVINLVCINSTNKTFSCIHRFTEEGSYYRYLSQIKLAEKNMHKTDNHIVWWKNIIKLDSFR